MPFFFDLSNEIVVDLPKLFTSAVQYVCFQLYVTLFTNEFRCVANKTQQCKIKQNFITRSFHRPIKGDMSQI